VEAGGDVAARQGLLLELGDGVAVLRVDEDEDAGLLRELEGLEEVLVLRVEGRALVGHKDLDRGYTLLGYARQLGLYVVPEVRDRDVEPVIYYRLVVGLVRPLFYGPV
jgi:hypothetical protein